MSVVQNFVVSSIQSEYDGSWTKYLQVIQLCLSFGLAKYGWTISIKDKNIIFSFMLLWMCCSYWVFLLHHHKLVHLLYKTYLIVYINVQTPEGEYFPSHFPFVFSPGTLCEKTGTQGSNRCVTIHSHLWNVLNSFYIKRLFLICRRF